MYYPVLLSWCKDNLGNNYHDIVRMQITIIDNEVA